MNAIVEEIQPGSIGESLGIQPGDVVVAVNQRSDLEDLLDYQFEVTDTDIVELHIKHTDGLEEIFEIEKDPEEELGLVFRSPLFTPIKTCNNACPFCFIDQQPEGLRPTLYVKDDDYRLSYFNNTYITLTNLTERDKARIARLRPGPLYVSVHSTVPEVRAVMLANPKAGNIMEKLQWLKSLEIPFHAQIVICPGINDGESLVQSLKDLNSLRPEALSVAVVPVGLTEHRGQLADLTPMTPAVAQSVIDTVQQFQADHHSTDFIYLSDEFYFKAGLSLPSYEAYGDFPQLDDGVGTATSLRDGFWQLEPALPSHLPSFSLDADKGTPRKILLITGKLGTMVLEPLVNRLNQIQGVYIDLKGIPSKFWGQGVSVAGLITGRDILDALQHEDLSGYTFSVIPGVMVKDGTRQLLDDMSVDEVAETLSLPFRIVTDSYSAKELVETVLA